MNHVLDRHEDGRTNLVLNRLPGWHGLGTVWEPGSQERLDLDLALSTARLAGWDVRLVPTFAFDRDEPITTGAYATLRNNPFDPDAPGQVLGSGLSEAYTVVQNEEAFEFGEHLIDEGMEVEAAGSLRGGTQTFVLFRVPSLITFGSMETVVPYLHVTTSHDGSLSVTAKPTGIRVVCGNTQAMSLADGQPTFRARHLGDGLKGRVQDARDAIGMVHGTLAGFQQEMDRWLHTPVSEDTFEAIIAASFPIDPEKAAPITITRQENRRDQVRALAVAPTNAEVRGTAWGVAQTLLEWNEWQRGGDKGRAARAVSPLAEDARRATFERVGRFTGLLPV